MQSLSEIKQDLKHCLLLLRKTTTSYCEHQYYGDTQSPLAARVGTRD